MFKILLGSSPIFYYRFNFVSNFRAIFIGKPIYLELIKFFLQKRKYLFDFLSGWFFLNQLYLFLIPILFR